MLLVLMVMEFISFLQFDIFFTMKQPEIHFEDIWNEVESLLVTQDSTFHSEQIKNYITDVQEDPNEKLGKVLVHLAALAKIYNINVAASMFQQLEDLKVENLE